MKSKLLVSILIAVGCVGAGLGVAFLAPAIEKSLETNSPEQAPPAPVPAVPEAEQAATLADETPSPSPTRSVESASEPSSSTPQKEKEGKGGEGGEGGDGCGRGGIHIGKDNCQSGRDGSDGEP
ncbi:MAG TPA: hypothetical protein VNZ52_12175 [Candidatus Thermoplasmatota archaeon]|nr:hypothetical protein [Candidatus Thermoplasmatota archaeon]